MKNQYFAKPYNGDVSGFYFTNYADYSEQAASLVDSYGEPVDELELYFIESKYQIKNEQRKLLGHCPRERPCRLIGRRLRKGWRGED